MPHPASSASPAPPPAVPARGSAGPPDWLWLLLPLACHVGFSWIGFAPTDEGWLQAIARRMMEGEVPHRDFISIRPVLSAIGQIPLVWLGGDHVLWLARLWGWLCIGGIAWIWQELAAGSSPRDWMRHLGYATALCLNAHVFPVMAWHTLDGLLLCSLALWLARRNTPATWRGAFLCAGAAALCRQNFALFVPFLLIGLTEWRQLKRAAWAALPLGLYLALLGVQGALPDFLHQILASRGALPDTALLRYGQSPAFILGLTAGACLGLISPRHVPRATPQLLFAGLGLGGAFALWRGMDALIPYSFGLLGLDASLFLALVWRGRIGCGERFLPTALLGLAWAGSISHGYNHPALVSGGLLLLSAHLLVFQSGADWRPTPGGRVVITLAAIGTGVAFWLARQSQPYQERPARELTFSVSEVLPGGAGLRTNARTHAILQELQGLTTQFEATRRPYAILTDYSAHWVRSPQRNPLPLEWPQSTELTEDRAINQRLEAAILDLPPGSVVILQKHLASGLPLGLFPVSIAPDVHRLQEWVRHRGRKLGESAYFELYQPPDRSP